MKTPDQYLKTLKRAAIVVCAFNVFSIVVFGCTQYFALNLQEWLVYFDPQFIVFVIWPAYAFALPSLVYLFPFGHVYTSLGRTISVAFLTIILCAHEALWCCIIAIGSFCRGPNWIFYWPWEEYVPNKVEPLYTISLSTLVWMVWFDQEMPQNMLLRELPGLLLLTVHLLVVPMFACFILSRFGASMPLRRIFVFSCVFQLLTIFPAKLALRWLIHLKYFVHFYEYFLNI